jgi:hypothetical protein
LLIVETPRTVSGRVCEAGPCGLDLLDGRCSLWPSGELEASTPGRGVGGDPPHVGGVVDAVGSFASLADDVAGSVVVLLQFGELAVELGQRRPLRVERRCTRGIAA